MVGIAENSPPNPTRNSMSGSARTVVQSEHVDNLVVGHERRGTLVLGAVGIALAATIAVVVIVLRPERSETGIAAPAVPLAAVAGYGPSCHAGWLVPDTGAETIPLAQSPGGDAVRGSGGELAVTVQGLVGKTVVLQSMRVDVVRRSPAPAGDYLPNSCQGEVPRRQYRLDLDVEPPRVVLEPGNVGFPYRVSDVEPEQLQMTPMVTDGDVEWRLRLAWTSGADSGELVVDDNGKPFHIAGGAQARAFCVDAHNGIWRRQC
ncbi:hypothetical protein [Actinokineospora inagensis]|uniref:hypothetical protein n=1 Tax=Actinokineospora inagensis TaxID=103730 RepID=UPI0012F8A73A|nr:hypothetical protein [Actinokineospora inagensis]